MTVGTNDDQMAIRFVVSVTANGARRRTSKPSVCTQLTDQLTEVTGDQSHNIYRIQRNISIVRCDADNSPSCVLLVDI